MLNYNLRIKLDIRKENYNNNSDSTYNISCLYTFYDPINNSIHKYKDENILINGTNSLNQGFQFMLYQINNECYKNVEYKEFIMLYKSESSIVSYLLDHQQYSLLLPKGNLSSRDPRYQHQLVFLTRLSRPFLMVLCNRSIISFFS